jgi:hypothetical protein
MNIEGEKKKIINNASLLVLHHIHASIADYFHSKRVRNSSTRFQHTIQSPKRADRLNKRTNDDDDDEEMIE